MKDYYQAEEQEAEQEERKSAGGKRSGPKKNSQLKVFYLENELGSNSCFLNVVIQNFWHLEGFRKALKAVIRWRREQEVESSAANPTFEALVEAMNRLFVTEEYTIASLDQLKQAFFRSQVGGGSIVAVNVKADAGEAFTHILESTHK